MSKSFNVRYSGWSSLDHAGLEFCWFDERRARGTLLRIDDDGDPFEVTYQFTWDAGFNVAGASIESRKGAEHKALHLRRGAHWQTPEGLLTDFEDCRDVDLWPTPLTNSFAILRLQLEVGQSREIPMLWIEAPALRFEKLLQRYTRLSDTIYLFESLDSGFQAEIEFDANGLVTLYPGLFKRTI